MPHKIGIVGAGGVGSIHAAILTKDSRVKLQSFLTSRQIAHKHWQAGLAEMPPAPSRFALNLDSATRLRDRAIGSGVTYQVGHNRRFAPVYKVLKQAIASNELRPLSVHAKMNRGELVNPPWVWNASLTGGFLYETPVHMFDLMTSFFGKVEWVEVCARDHERGSLMIFPSCCASNPVCRRP